MHLLQAKVPLTKDTIWLSVWELMKPSDWKAYLIIAAAGIVFSLLIGSRKTVKEILQDVLIKTFFVAVIYLLGIAFVFYMMKNT